MNRLRSAAALAVVVTLSGGAITTASVAAAPTDVHVRVEGVFRTVFDRVVRTDGHAIRATSDTEDRRCDGTNNGYNATPGPTATGAAVDAMAQLGATFDGDWYRGYDDYFVTQFADERQDSGKGWFWGILVNRAFTPVGGCQFQVKTGDEVLWINNGFNGRPFLELSGPPQAVAGQPVSVAVTGTESFMDTTGASTPYAGATVSAVDANGQPKSGVALPATTTSAGTATVTFAASGWQRLKARQINGSESPLAIASNSIDVCVRASAGAPDCAGSPPSQVPAGTERPEPTTPDPTTPEPTTPQSTTPEPSTPHPGAGTAPGNGTPSTTAPPITTTPLGQNIPPLGPGARRWKAFIDDARISVGRKSGWVRRKDAGAWNGTITAASAGSALKVRLVAGRPVVLVRGVRKTAKLELRSGKVRRTVTIKGNTTAASREIALGRSVAAGRLEVRVVRGSVAIDGVGVA